MHTKLRAWYKDNMEEHRHRFDLVHIFTDSGVGGDSGCHQCLLWEP